MFKLEAIISHYLLKNRNCLRRWTLVLGSRTRSRKATGNSLAWTRKRIFTSSLWHHSTDPIIRLKRLRFRLKWVLNRIVAPSLSPGPAVGLGHRQRRAASGCAAVPFDSDSGSTAIEAAAGVRSSGWFTPAVQVQVKFNGLVQVCRM